MKLKKPQIEHADTFKVISDNNRFKGYFLCRCYDENDKRAFPYDPIPDMDVPTVTIDIDQDSFPLIADLLKLVSSKLTSMGHELI